MNCRRHPKPSQDIAHLFTARIDKQGVTKVLLKDNKRALEEYEASRGIHSHLLLGPKLVGVSALLLPAVLGARRKARVAPDNVDIKYCVE